jgi:hypothetical protein
MAASTRVPVCAVGSIDGLNFLAAGRCPLMPAAAVIPGHGRRGRPWTKWRTPPKRAPAELLSWAMAARYVHGIWLVGPYCRTRSASRVAPGPGRSVDDPAAGGGGSLSFPMGFIAAPTPVRGAG